MEKTILIKSSSKTLQPRPVKYYIDNNRCWICTSHSKSYGYPCIMLDYKRKRLSRVIYEMFNGKIEKNMVIMHLCDNPNCINPQHLKVGTHKQNSQDMVNKNRNKVGEEHHSAKLKKEDILYIRNSNKTCNRLAKELNVSTQNILSIKHYKTWKKV